MTKKLAGNVGVIGPDGEPVTLLSGTEPPKWALPQITNPHAFGDAVPPGASGAGSPPTPAGPSTSTPPPAPPAPSTDDDVAVLMGDDEDAVKTLLKQATVDRVGAAVNAAPKEQRPGLAAVVAQLERADRNRTTLVDALTAIAELDSGS